MKKGLLYLLMLVMSASMFTACSDDDDSYKALTAEYKADKLNFTFNNKTIIDRAVSLEALNETTGHLALKNMIAGEDSLVVNITMENIGGDNFSFTGKNETADRSVSVTGDVKNGVMTLSSTFKILSSVVGKWETFSEYEGTSLYVDIKNDKDSVTLPLMFGGKVSGTDLGQSLGLVGMILPQLLADIELCEDGTLIAHYYADLTSQGAGKAPLEEKDLVTYNVKDGMIYILIDINTLMSRSSYTPDIMGLIKTGIPLKFTVKEGKLRAYVDKQMMLPFLQLLPVLAPSIKDVVLPEPAPSFGFTGELIAQLMIDVVPVIQNAEKADLGLDLRTPVAGN